MWTLDGTTQKASIHYAPARHWPLSELQPLQKNQMFFQSESLFHLFLIPSVRNPVAGLQLFKEKAAWFDWTQLI